MLWLILLCYCLVASTAGGCSITNITASSVTSTSVLLRWSESEDCSGNKKNYSITASHVKYKACLDHLAFTGRETEVASNAEAKRALVSGLEPYSIYSFNIYAKVDLRVFLQSSGIDNGPEVTLKSDFKVETASAQPQVRPQSGEAVPGVQAIQFNWELPSLESTCPKQRGKFDGFYLELYGNSPWHSGLIRNETKPENVLYYYAQNLKPFTDYRLMVYVRNKNGLYNKDLPLKLTAKTRPHKPEPPKNTRASVVAGQDIHLSWQPSYPPTGDIKDYKLRFGPKQEPMVWEKEITIGNETDLCSTKQKKFVCTRLYKSEDKLEPNTTYAFQVQAFNNDVNQPSEYSEIFEATTDPLPEPPTTPKPRVEESEEPKENRHHSVSNQVIVICVLTVIFIIVLVIIIAALIYKNKMIKLKAQYEASQRQLQHDLSRSLSVIGYNESIADTTITSVTNYRLANIQNRRLPDPPAPGQVIHQDFYANNPDLIANVRDLEDLEDEHYLKPMTFAEEEEDNDYLKPTFEYPKSDTDAILNTPHQPQHSTIIPTESYVSAVTLEPPRTISPLSQDNEIRPLILSLRSSATTK